MRVIPIPRISGTGAVALFFISTLTGAAQAQEYYPPPEADGGWRKNTDPDFVRSLGLDPEKLEEFVAYNTRVPPKNTETGRMSDYASCIVIKNGWIVAEWYSRPDARTFRQYLSSNGKSFAMACFGMVVEDSRHGRLKVKVGIDSKVYDTRWLPEGFPLSDPRKSEITFHHLFKHQSGILPESVLNPWHGWNKADWDFRLFTVGRDKEYPQSAPLQFDPGTKSDYSSTAYDHISLVFPHLTGSHAHEFLWERLLKPIGFGRIDYQRPPKGPHKWSTGGALRMTPRDYARFAYLLLRNGTWGDRQLVPASWIRQFTTSPDYSNIRSNVDGRFGSHLPKNVFRIAGSGLNWAFIVPSLDLIAIRTSRSPNRMWNEVRTNFLEKLFAAAALPQGQIVVDPANPRWLKRQGGDPLFMCGPGDPEGFLHRGRRQPDGTRSGDQTALIEKLKGTGANCIYLQAVRSHGGDGDRTQNPFVDSDPAKGLDPDILDQWDRWFTEMDRNGIVILFFLYDDSVRIWKGHRVGPEERAFIRGLVGKFKHHKNLIWCVAEESREAFSDRRIRAIAAEIRAADDRRHPIAVHLNIGLDFSAFADDPNIDQFAVQWDESKGLPIHEAAVKVWKSAEGKFNVNMAEMFPSPPGDPKGPGPKLGEPPPALKGFSGGGWRRRSWAAAMAGAYSMHLWMEIAHTPVGDLEDCGRLVRFMESTNFTDMAPHDELRFEGTQYVLARPGKSYIAYASALSGKVGLKGLKAGRYTLRWFDCANGKSVTQEGIRVKAGDRAWSKPSGIGREVAVYVRRTGN